MLGLIPAAACAGAMGLKALAVKGVAVTAVAVKAVAAKGMAAKATTAKGMATKTVAVKATAAKGMDAGLASSRDLSLSVLFGSTAAGSTTGGIIFVELHDKLLDDLQGQVQREGRRMPTRSELACALERAYRNATEELKNNGWRTPAGEKEMDKIYSNCHEKLQFEV